MVLSRVETINDMVRVFRLDVDPARPVKVRPSRSPSLIIPSPKLPRASLIDTPQFLPGQWLDVFVPDVHSPGGFSISSPPSKATGPHPYLELAVQSSHYNPPAVWMWLPDRHILGAALKVRVGGSFVWPPEDVDVSGIERVVFVAGGVGINPLIAILSHLAGEKSRPYDIRFLYSTKTHSTVADSGTVLFLHRLRGIFDGGLVTGGFQLFITGGAPIIWKGSAIDVQNRRISLQDLEAAVGSAEDRSSTLVYLCGGGSPSMVDEFAELLTSAGALGMDKRLVRYEKWW